MTLYTLLKFLFFFGTFAATAAERSQSIAIPIRSNIISLSCLSKDQKKIYILGFATNKSYSSIKGQTLSQNNSFLQLTQSSAPLGFLTLQTACEIEETRGNEIYPTLDNFAHHSITSQKREALGNLHCILLPEDSSADLQEKINQANYFFSTFNWNHLFEQFGFTPGSNIDTIDPTLNQNPEFKEEFFKEDGIFFDFRKDFLPAYLKYDSLYTLFSSCSEYCRFIEQQDHAITASLRSLSDRWTAAKNNAMTYLHELKNDKKDPLLLELVLQDIAEKKSFQSGLFNFQLIVLEPLRLQKMHRVISHIQESLKNYDTLLFFYYSPFVKDLIQELEAIGFSNSSWGTLLEIEPNSEISFTQKASPFFSYDQLDTFFNAIKTGTDYHHTPLTNDLSFHYFDPHTNDYSGNSPRNHTRTTCLQCPHIIPACDAYASSTNGICCTLDCLIKYLVTQEKTPYSLATLLNPEHTLTTDEKNLLNCYGILCSLQIAVCEPCIEYKTSTLYQLPFSYFIEKLQEIEDYSTKCPTSLWARTLALSQSWGISLPQIKAFLQLYKTQKDTYLKALLKQQLEKKSNLNDTSFDDEDILFPGNNFWKSIQDGFYKTIKSELQLLPETFHKTVLCLYKQLLMFIKQRTNFTMKNSRALLTIRDIIPLYDDQSLCGPVQDSRPLKKRANNTLSPAHEAEAIKFDLFENDFLSSQEEIEENLSFLEAPSALPVRKERPLTQTISGMFAGVTPYTITLFSTQKYIPKDLQHLQTVLRLGKAAPEAKRITIPFGYLESRDIHEVKQNQNNCPALVATEENSSFVERLDLHHLFPRSVDRYLLQYGIAEQIENFTQISIPGEFFYNETRRVGFFQYSYNDKGICIHRCFKPYAAPNSQYISFTLRRILLDFLVGEGLDKKYKNVTKNLKSLIHQGAG